MHQRVATVRCGGRCPTEPMQINVEFRPRRQEDRTVEVPSGATVADLVEAVGESVDIIVAVRGETPVPEDTELRDGETLLLLSAASGG